MLMSATRKTVVLMAALGALAATTRANAQEAKVPQVGKPAFTAETYKPVVGTYGGRIVRDMLGEPKSFNPVTAGETSTTDFTNRIFEALTTLDPFTGEYVPQLAESWKVAEDKCTWTFKLKPGIQFSDGTPLTARDVEFTWNELIYDNKRPASAKDPRWPSSTRDVVQVDDKPIEVKAIDDLTVQVRTASPTALLLGWMSTAILPEKAYGAAARDGSFGGKLGTDARSEDVVATGPWLLKEYVRGDHVSLKRNPNYWRKDAAGNRLPYLDEMIFRVAGNLNIELLNFQQGVTDKYALASGREVPVLKPQQEKGDFTLWQLGPSYSTEFVAFNMNEESAAAGKIEKYKVEWFRDKRFRVAVAHAVDRASLIRNVLRNLGRPLAAPFTVAPGPLTQEGFAAPKYDPAESRRLLAEMGFKPGPDGVLADAAGHQLAFNLTTNAGNTVREQFCEFIKKDLESIGMKVNYLPLQFNLLVEKLNTTYDWDAMVMGFTGTMEPNDGANLWRSDARMHLWWPKQKEPGFGWEKRIDEVFSSGLKELDSAKRKEIYRGWTQTVVDEQPMVYLVCGERVVAIRNKFGNLAPSPTPTTYPDFHNEEYIFILPGKK